MEKGKIRGRGSRKGLENQGKIASRCAGTFCSEGQKLQTVGSATMDSLRLQSSLPSYLQAVLQIQNVFADLGFGIGF